MPLAPHPTRSDHCAVRQAANVVTWSGPAWQERIVTAAVPRLRVPVRAGYPHGRQLGRDRGGGPRGAAPPRTATIQSGPIRIQDVTSRDTVADSGSGLEREAHIAGAAPDRLCEAEPRPVLFTESDHRFASRAAITPIRNPCWTDENLHACLGRLFVRALVESAGGSQNLCPDPYATVPSSCPAFAARSSTGRLCSGLIVCSIVKS
jgi:hypothetical protein